MKTFISTKTVLEIDEGGKPYPAFVKNGRTINAGISKKKYIISNEYGDRISLTVEEFQALKTFD